MTDMQALLQTIDKALERWREMFNEQGMWDSQEYIDMARPLHDCLVGLTAHMIGPQSATPNSLARIIAQTKQVNAQMAELVDAQG